MFFVEPLWEICHITNLYMLLNIECYSGDTWKDNLDNSCQYYEETPTECGAYNMYSKNYPEYPLLNPCCVCKGKLAYAINRMELT